ncbi:hypothetical protein AVEN_20814-1 [Araneus ventricosus]|uniref:DNA helicase n=1 Tax=Araneus ventricosus TaxID=182803 RepID=A0A4Y2FWA1_ARAVE|nr:hypothetical protein AVEN_20814-1 [Araneus ventricosus]
MREQWKDIEFLFIDEISMVPYEMLCMIENRLQQLKTDNVLFGGINLIVFGDLMFTTNQRISSFESTTVHGSSNTSMATGASRTICDSKAIMHLLNY